MSLLRAFSFCCLFALLGGTLSATAQTPNDGDPLLRGSNRALSFSIDNVTLGTVDGGVGGRWWLSPNTAFRTTLSLSVESIEEVIEGEVDMGRSAFGIGTSFLVELHTRQFRRVSPYVAGGVGVRYDVFSETTSYGPENPLRELRDKGDGVDFSVSAGFGVEVYLVKSVSISGEHLFVASVRSEDGTITRSFQDAPTTVTQQDGTSFLFGTGTSSLIISVYF
jgi:hypothetical protein